MVKRYYQKHKKKHVKNIKISLMKRKGKNQKRPKIEKKKGVSVSIQQKCKQKLPEYRRKNYFT